MPALPITDHEARKAVVRRILTYNPTITVLALKERLEKSEPSVTIGLNQLYDIVGEIRKDRIEAIEKETKEDIYAQIVDLVNDINNQLRSIAQEERLVYMEKLPSKDGKEGDPALPPKVRIFAQQNRIKALNSIVENTIKLLNFRMDLGLIERKLGEVDLRITDLVAGLRKIRNGDYTTPLPTLIESLGETETKESRGEGDGGKTTPA